jgi:hypothetical protein
MPRLLSLDNVGFGDGGFDINVQALINQGYRAGIDFGYPYGALSLFYSKLWFSLLGLGPRAFCAGLLASDVIFALAMARFIWLIRVKACGITLGLIGAVLGVMGAFTLAHGLERACLSWALAEQIDSRRPRALALAAVAVLAKPSMGFVYGAWLIVLILCELRREACLTGARLAREFGPAPLAGGVLAAGLSLIYGPPVVAHLLLPLTGAKAYQLNGFGFLGRTGRTFWYFPGVHLAYYFGTPVAFWFTATLYLFVGADVAERHLMGPSGRDDASDETVITCALMHLAFVSLFFGSNASWTNYVYVLVVGTAIISGWPGRFKTIAWGLVLLGFAGQKGMVAGDLKRWKDTAPLPETVGLWAPAGERDEWRRVLALAQGGQAVVLSGDGAAQVLFPQMVAPVAASLIPGQTSAVPRQLILPPH